MQVTTILFFVIGFMCASAYAKKGFATYYNLGMTACGQSYRDSDAVAAVGFNYFTTPNPNKDPICGRKVKVTDPTTGKNVIVAIRDKCQSCTGNDNIDLSPSAFLKLRPLKVGKFPVQWDFV